jgi:hypothetical protein
MPKYESGLKGVRSTVEPIAALSEEQAAYYLGISRSSLRKSRMNGARTNYLPPPPYIKLGRRVIYLLDDLHNYLGANRAGGGMAMREGGANQTEPHAKNAPTRQGEA